MIDQEDDCIDIITQLTAIRSSLDSTIGVIIAENLKECLNNPLQDPKEQTDRIEKAIKMIVRK